MEHARRVAALLYLIFSDSLLGYSAFGVRNRRLPVPRLSPLPDCCGGGRVGLFILPGAIRLFFMAMIVIFGGVALVKLYNQQSIR